MYHQQPVAPNVVWVCRTLSCDLRGARELQNHLEKRFGCHANGTSKDGKFTLKTAECLAACGQAPMVQINDDFHENLTIESLDRLISDIAAKTAVGSS
jgi:NADH-quinone oxidoreductase subunit E